VQSSAPWIPTPFNVLNAQSWSSAVNLKKIVGGSILVKTITTFNASQFAGTGAVSKGKFVLPSSVWWHLSVPTGNEATACLSLSALPGVLSIEPENILRLPQDENTSNVLTPIPLLPSLGRTLLTRSLGYTSDGKLLLNDPEVVSAEYSLTITHALDAYEAYPLPTTDTQTVSAPFSPWVAVLDTGINLNHQDLELNAGTQSSFQAYSMFTTTNYLGEPATGFTYVGDGTPPVSVSRYTQANDASATLAQSNLTDWDDDGHGTHVAGIIAAVGNNGEGGAGVMWSGVNLLSYKVVADTETTTTGSGTDWAVYGALYWLTQRWNKTSMDGNNPVIAQNYQKTLPVNVSLGTTQASSFEMDMISYALQNNVLVVSAMGNDGQTMAEYPAAYSGVIAVGATEGNDTLAPFSTSGNWISVVAPGFDIVSTLNTSSTDYGYESGTSMATPFVTGLIAYMISQNPGLTPDQIKAILEDTSDDVAGTRNSDWALMGAGRVDVKNALDEATGSNGRSTPAPGQVFSGEPLVITLTPSSTGTNGVPVYLYDHAGNFVGAELTTNTDFGLSGTGSVQSSVRFWLLKPGNYTAKAADSTGTLTGSVSVLVPVGASSPITASIVL
jgi:thermitase